MMQSFDKCALSSLKMCKKNYSNFVGMRSFLILLASLQTKTNFYSSLKIRGKLYNHSPYSKEASKSMVSLFVYSLLCLILLLLKHNVSSLLNCDNYMTCQLIMQIAGVVFLKGKFSSGTEF